MHAGSSAGNGGEREDFVAAAEYFVGMVEAVGDEWWDRPGLGEWTVRDLVGHTSRSLITVRDYLDRPATAAELVTAADYYFAARAQAPAAIAQRGRDAGTALGDRPAEAVRALAAEALERLGRAHDDDLLTTPAGGMRVATYLRTRTFELTVHTIDLARATGQTTAPPDGPARSSLLLAAEQALLAGAAATVLGALTGRHGLPPGFTVL